MSTYVCAAPYLIAKYLTMITVRTISEMQILSRTWRKNGKTIALIPTMGYLHQGHHSLIEIGKEKAEITVVSIFVNPTQFSPDEDLDAYPRDFLKDEQICSDLGVSVIFYPSSKEMYPENFSTWVVEEKLSKPLCGRSRPTHFRGVTTVVSKLFLAVLPDVAVFGQKDAQQALIIKRMVQNLNFPIEILLGPIVREKDGLAMSSRNKYLDQDQRTEARAIYHGLEQSRNAFENGETDGKKLKDLVRNPIIKSGGILEYIQCVSMETLEEINQVSTSALIAVAVRYGSTRLIDNCILRKK